MAPSNEELLQIIHKASSKIRELRELIENLSKKLCISENSESLKMDKLKKTIEKLRMENKRLFNDKNELENHLSPSSKQPHEFYQSMIPKAPGTKSSNFFSKHKLRPSSKKNLKTPGHYSKASILQ